MVEATHEQHETAPKLVPVEQALRELDSPDKIPGFLADTDFSAMVESDEGLTPAFRREFGKELASGLADYCNGDEANRVVLAVKDATLFTFVEARKEAENRAFMGDAEWSFPVTAEELFATEAAQVLAQGDPRFKAMRLAAIRTIEARVKGKTDIRGVTMAEGVLSRVPAEIEGIQKRIDERLPYPDGKLPSNKKEVEEIGRLQNVLNVATQLTPSQN